MKIISGFHRVVKSEEHVKFNIRRKWFILQDQIIKLSWAS